MQAVASGLRAEVDDAAGEFAPVRAQVAGLDLEFLDRVLGRNHHGKVDVADIERLPVQVFRAFIAERTVHLKVAPAERIDSDGRAARAALRDHGRG